ncbi:MAG TPA: ABC transporter permease [Gemmatimonadaceae bacterium]|nr:ABC transporter permease [Gemmatimonadaceae bacterium]
MARSGNRALQQQREGATLPSMPSARTTISEMLRELVEFRELLRAIVRRDLVLRYHNSVLGFGWAIAMPALYMVIFTVVFTRVAPLATDIPYPIYAYAGLLPWNLFASAQRFSAISLTVNPHLVTKVYFPREILPFAAVIVALFDFLVASILMAALMAYYDVGVTTAVFFLPVVLLVQLAFTAGVALLVAMANLFYADVKYVLELLLTLWMFATSVVYPIDNVGGTAGRILALNPMTPIVDAYRSVLLRGELPPSGPFIAVAIVAVLTLGVGWYTFHRAEFRLAEEL